MSMVLPIRLLCLNLPLLPLQTLRTLLKRSSIKWFPVILKPEINLTSYWCTSCSPILRGSSKNVTHYGTDEETLKTRVQVGPAVWPSVLFSTEVRETICRQV